MPAILVIGGGVIGLSAARCLQKAGYAVHIITRELPEASASMAAGAVWSGSDLYGVQRQWAAATLEYLLAQAAIPDSGVSLRTMREVFAQPVPDPWYRELLPAFARLPAAALPPGLAAGYRLQVPIVAPPIYLRRLQAQFLEAGGTLETRALDSLEQVAGAAPIIVHCSGVGARQLAADSGVYPIRGQTVLIDAPNIRSGYMDNSAIDHIFPRSDGVLLGGVKLPGDWNREPDAAISADIIARASAIEPSVAAAPRLRHFVGLRPGRAQVRLEAAALPAGGAVIHNYGHGSVGYTLSWGCARAVLALVRQLEAR